MTLPQFSSKRSALSLADFDLDEAALSRIITDAHAARQRVGPNFPKNARGLIFYFHIISGLRTHLLNKPGWVTKVVCGLEFVEHETWGLRLGYLAGDDGTGHPEKNLSSAHARGSTSKRSTTTNLQLAMKFPVDFFDGFTQKVLTW